MGRVLALRSEFIVTQSPQIQTFVPPRDLSFLDIVQYGFPNSRMDKEMRRWKMRNLRNLFRGLSRMTIAKSLKIPFLQGQWCLCTISPDGQIRDYGLVSLRMITTTGAGYVVDAFQGLQTISNMRYHGVGTGSGAESASDTGLTEAASSYNPSFTRATGTLTEGVSATIFRTVGNITLSATVTIGEVGLFSQASTTTGTPTGGYMLDRGVVSSETVFANFVIQSDYRLTVATGT